VHHSDIARDTQDSWLAVLAALPKREILTQSFPRAGGRWRYGLERTFRLNSHEAGASLDGLLRSGLLRCIACELACSRGIGWNNVGIQLHSFRHEAQARACGGHRFPERAWTIPRGTLMRKILIMGLPGAGKTTLATALAPLIQRGRVQR
jgi:hypothetical protein